MPYHIIKKIKMLYKGSSAYQPTFAVDLEDDKTWNLFKLYHDPSPEIRGIARKLIYLDGTIKDTIEKNFGFLTQTECHYTVEANTHETRQLLLPTELVQAYGIDENMAIELVLNEIVYYSQQQVEPTHELAIYESKTVEGPKDVIPKDNDEINIEKLTLEHISNVEDAPIVAEKKEHSNRVFIVHGHDDLPKERLAHILIELGLTPIILHDQPNKGRTLVEKFEEEASDVGYAFVIMTADDLGIEAKLHEEIQKGVKQGGLCFRSRQNVVFELGFFYGKLGRKRVCCLVKGDIEKPSDFSGIVYLPFINKVDEVYRDIIKELRALDYTLKSQ
jgi:predicted nucleotide-binding protein